MVCAVIPQCAFYSERRLVCASAREPVDQVPTPVRVHGTPVDQVPTPVRVHGTSTYTFVRVAGYAGCPVLMYVHTYIHVHTQPIATS